MAPSINFYFFIFFNFLDKLRHQYDRETIVQRPLGLQAILFVFAVRLRKKKISLDYQNYKHHLP